MITALASALHGIGHYRGYKISKGVVLAGLALVYALIGVVLLGWFGLLAALLAPAWRYGLRTGAIADVENDTMDTFNQPNPGAADVMLAYLLPLGVAAAAVSGLHVLTTGVWWLGLVVPPLCLLPAMATQIWNYSTKPGQRAGWPQMYMADGLAPHQYPFWDCRRHTEFAAGLVGDVIFWLLIGGLVYAAQ